MVGYRRRNSRYFGISIHLGLLEHDLGDEHAVGLARVSPGEIAAVVGVPREQTALKAADEVARGQSHSAQSITRSPRAGRARRSGDRVVAAERLRRTAPGVGVVLAPVGGGSQIEAVVGVWVDDELELRLALRGRGL